MENAIGAKGKGILKKFKNSAVNTVNFIIDGFLHINTTKAMFLSEHDNKVNYMYEPFPYIKMKRLFENFSFSESDGFMDIGCGKGRVLVGAALSGCVNVYGIDISKELLEYAEKNLAECKKKKADLKYRLLCMDARDFTFMPDINKVFFYNPFSYRVFLKVKKALKQSIEENPRDITIFLAGPEHVSRYLVGDKGFFFYRYRSKERVCIQTRLQLNKWVW